MELRWDGVPSLAEPMKMLKEQAKRTPPSQWVRVAGGFCASESRGLDLTGAVDRYHRYGRLIA